MNPKLPHIPTRDFAGSFSLNNPDDGTPIKEVFTLGDGLLLITEKCTYRVQVADQIDPERKNPALPHNVQQKIVDHGTESQLLCNTLLLGKVLFRKEFLNIDVDQAQELAFEALGELVAMHEAAQDFKAIEQTALEKTAQSPHTSSIASGAVSRQRTGPLQDVHAKSRSFCRRTVQDRAVVPPGPEKVELGQFL